ncbi:MAG: hypothetical protein IPG60_07635 [Bacteroidetes bacterium]|nr:hypothetical protein [Bacteroidota bacterium]
MLMPNRSWSAVSEYRFGFGGQEQDDEVYGQGNLNTAMFWEYDTRLGRRWNLDPVDQFQSNYAVFLNNPVLIIDINGMAPKLPWELRVDDEGNTSYEATSAKDDIYSFMNEYNTEFVDAAKIFNQNNLEDYVPPVNIGLGRPVAEGTILQADYKSLNWENSNNQQKGNQVLQTLKYLNSQETYYGPIDLDNTFTSRPSFSETGITHAIVSTILKVDNENTINLRIEIPLADGEKTRFLTTTPSSVQGVTRQAFGLGSYDIPLNSGARMDQMTIIVKPNNDPKHLLEDFIFYPDK